MYIDNNNSVIGSQARLFKPFLILVIVAFATFAIKTVVVAAPVASLNGGPELSGMISQSLGSPDPESGYESKSLLVAGVDYTIKSAVYLDNHTWAVVSLTPANNNENGFNTIVFHIVNSTYQVVLAPNTTSLSLTSSQSIPKDVTDYLTSQGIVVNVLF